MNIFQTVRALRPGRSAFNLSYEKKFNCDLGQLIPIMCDEVLPGDFWNIGLELVVRLTPMLTPVLHEITAYAHYYFVPNRLVDENWEDIITGGVTGADATAIPRWIPTGGNVTNDDGRVLQDNSLYSLWDYMNFPTAILPTGLDAPIAYPRRAYNLVYNEFYRDQTQQTAISLDSTVVKNRCWEKDYFTSALPWQQRGTAPAVPLTGTTAAVWADAKFVDTAPDRTVATPAGAGAPWLQVQGADARTNLKNTFNANTVSLAGAGTFDIATLRLVTQIQKWMERNARGGVRYTEFLGNHFGENPRDDRLQRPEYIGGTKVPIIVSEVLQTSESATTPQGTMVGHGLAAGKDFCARYKAKEFGIIIGILSIMPKPTYHQGIDRQWLKQTRYDYYMPEFAHLSEQAIYREELFATSVLADNQAVWGYQGRWNELRTKQSRLNAGFRYGALLNSWSIPRQWAAAPALNGTFMTCIPLKGWLAASSQPACIVNAANIIKAVRPLPVESDPGLVDH